MSLPAEDLELALELADLADEITLARFRSADLVVDTKPDMTPVSEADREVERALRERLAQERPGDVVVGEEYGAAQGSRRWIVDPIDGTKGFVRGVPVWATLIALQDSDELTVGVCSAPALQRRWWALRGGGAWGRDPLSGGPRRLSVSAVSELADAQLSVGDNIRLDGVADLSARCWRTRGFGDFWQHMLVAEGAIEIAIEPEVSIWDMAAVLVIVREAGGRLTDLGGIERADGGSAIATNGLLHEVALGYLG